MQSDFAAPLDLGGESVRPEWIDYNGHMNVAYYVLAFDHGVDRLFDAIGVGVDYVRRENRSVFVLENHVSYLQELTAGAPLRVSGQLLDWDAKRLHAFLRMHHGEKDFVAATYEFLGLHVDMASRKSAPFPAATAGRLAGLLERHRALPRPEQAGRRIGIRRQPG